MKTENVYIQALDREFVFYIGKNQDDNFNVIDMGNENDLWFHAKDIPSCHVVCKIPDDIEKKDLRYIIKTGALLCKNNTNQIKNLSKIPFVYTKLKNVIKMLVKGRVMTLNTKIIIC